MPASLLVTWLLCVCQIASAATLTGQVIIVYDGDSLVVLDAEQQRHQIRLQAIDAPEKDQAFAQPSKQNLFHLVFGQTVEVDDTKHDQYDRVLGTVWLAGHDIGLAQISAGLAWHYQAYPTEPSKIDRHAYAQAQTMARKKHLGLWSESQPIPPWECRHRGTTRPASAGR